MNKRSIAMFLPALLAFSVGVLPKAAAIHAGAPVPPSPSSGTIRGQVLLTGSRIPRATEVENTTDPGACAKLQSLENVIINSENHGIKNAILSLKGVPLPEGHRPKPSLLVLDNRECRFQPHVAVLTTGSSIEAVNSDPIFHSVHLYGFRNINLALAPKSAKAIQALKRPGFVIVRCDIHGWMQAFIRVDEHPFHAVSSADGSFRIEGIPAGTYTLEVWHEHFGPLETTVKVDAGLVSRVIVYYQASK